MNILHGVSSLLRGHSHRCGKKKNLLDGHRLYIVNFVFLTIGIFVLKI